MSGQVGTGIYSKTTVPPAASRAAFSFSASSLDTLARISWGRDSTSFLAWFGKARQKQRRFNEVTKSVKRQHATQSNTFLQGNNIVHRKFAKTEIF